MPTNKSRSKTAAKPAAARKVAAKTARAGKAPPVAAAEPLAAPAAVGHETMATVLKAGTQAATKGYENAFAIAQEQIEKASQTLFERYDEAANFGQDNVEACVLSGTVFAKGFESVGKELINIAQSAVEANVATTQALLGATTVRELIDLQTEFSRSCFDSLVAESAKLTELSLTLANDAIEPLQTRLNATVEKLVKPLAA